jgi:hypothetical protein
MAMTATLMQECQEVLDGANACPEHSTGLTMGDVAEVIAAFDGCYCEWNGREACNSYCDSEGAAIVRLKDGRYASFFEDADTTGHG